MKDDDYKITILVNASAQEVYSAINNVSKWWTEDLEGNSKKLRDEFTVHFGDVHISTQRVIMLMPGEKIVWLVTDSKLNFIKDQQEWNNTEIIFDISERDGKTEIHFTHKGLVPSIECYNSCAKGWDYYIKGSLFKLLSEGKGMPG